MEFKKLRGQAMHDTMLEISNTKNFCQDTHLKNKA